MIFGSHRTSAAAAARTLTVSVMLALTLGVLAPRAQASFGVQSIEVAAESQNGSAATQAGLRPYELTIAMTLQRKSLTQLQREDGLGDAGPLGEEIAEGDPKDVETTLPAGMMVDLLGVPRCTEQQLARQACQASSQVGDVAVDSPLPLLAAIGQTPVFNIAPSSPNVAGALGFTFGGIGLIAHLIGSDHAGGDYGISALVPGISQIADADGITLTLWGQPSAPSHCHQTATDGPCIGVPEVQEAFLTMPTSCPADTTPAEMSESSVSTRADSWQEPGIWTPLAYSAPLPPQTGCERLSFTPSIEVTPETTTVDEPTGVSIALKLPQSEAAGTLAESTMREALITLPSGLAISPSAVSGLGACSEAQIDLDSAAPAACPEDSRIGSVEARTPLLDHAVYGSVYVAQQGNAGSTQGSNPFDSLLAMYLVVEGSGVQIKVAGAVSINQATGQLTARFAGLPQVPYSELTLHFFGGPRAALVPLACGSYTTTSMLTPWSAPQSGPPATPQNTFQVSSGCATGAFVPMVVGGTTNNQAGGYGPLEESVSRRDGEQEFTAVQERMPKGLVADISHVQLCAEPQAQQGTCGPESQIGEISAATGPGPDPLRVSGRIYFTGPYDGAPFGIVVVVPARAGPFNLGNVVVRLALSIDPKTAEAVVTTVGPLPRIFQGVPLQIKGATVTIDRPEFIFNPTSCGHKTITTSIAGSLGTVTTVQVPFQASGCAGLEFKPHLAVYATGQNTKQNGVGVDVKLTVPQAPATAQAGEATGGQANFAKVRVELPSQLPARLTTIQKACPSKIFEANPAQCPAASIVAVARASTPILPVQFGGPAYFVSFGNAKFPELVVVIQGDGIVAQLHGETFISKQGVTSATFPEIPDVPVSSFELYFPPGPQSALTTTSALCNDGALTLPTSLVAQNGIELNQRLKIEVTGCAKASAKKAKGAKRAKQARRAHSASTSPAGAPLVSTGPASAVSDTEATLSGTVQREGATCSYAFELGTTSAYGTTIAGTLSSTAPETQTVTLAMENLAPATTYHYRLVATNARSMGQGADETFTTPGPSTSLAVPPAPPLLAVPAVAFPVEPPAEPSSPSPTSTAGKAKPKKHDKQHKKHAAGRRRKPNSRRGR